MLVIRMGFQYLKSIMSIKQHFNYPRTSKLSRLVKQTSTQHCIEYWKIYSRCSMVLVYLPTLDDVWGKCFPEYSSTMGCIWLGKLSYFTHLNLAAIKGNDSPIKTMIPGLGRTGFGSYNLPRYG